ncbi:MAG TPA: glycosyltransferase family 9 protein [Holophaga sp.]|nr:glycosyltransferase family 9 protein [Holophaga sp.]
MPHETPSPAGSCRIRHTQLLFKKEAGRCLAPLEVGIRIGDLVALMMCAEYVKRFEGRRIIFQLMSRTHQSLKADILFKHTIDGILLEEGPVYGLDDPDLPDIYDPGPLWMASTYYHQRHGADIIPRLNLDPACYGGPELAWGSYVVFHPLFDPSYNTPRGMDATFVNAFCDQLAAALGERALVITDQPDRIRSKIRVITSDSLYDLACVIGHARAYIGGDTGFTHLAAAGRVPELHGLYGPRFERSARDAFADVCFDDLVNPFASWGKYLGTPMDTRPKCDPAATRMQLHILEGNRLEAAEMEAIIGQLSAPRP